MTYFIKVMSAFSMTALCVTAAPAAPAASPLNESMNVRIQIVADCTMAAPADLDFGAPGLLTAERIATTNLSVTCTNTTPYQVALGEGAHYDLTVTRRRMAGGSSEFVAYDLCRDQGCTQLWGATTGAGGDVQARTGNGAPQVVTVYGRVPAQDTPSPGNYTDVVSVTVTY